MSERLNVPVLKTGEGNTSGGSNPPLPATHFMQSNLTTNIADFETFSVNSNYDIIKNYAYEFNKKIF